MISFILEASENSLNNLTSLKKEHLVYVILRDSKLFELRDKVVKIPQLQGRVLNYYLPKIMEEKQIQVLNLLKEIEIEYPEIHLQMKSCLRNLGMYQKIKTNLMFIQQKLKFELFMQYNEEFGIQVSQEQYNDKVRLKLQDVNIDNLLSILSNKQNSFTKWESLLRINYTVELNFKLSQLYFQLSIQILVDITLEELGQFIKRDYKLENLIFELIKIPYHKSSQTLIEQIKDQEQSFLVLRAFQNFSIPSLLSQNNELSKQILTLIKIYYYRIWLKCIFHAYEYDTQNLHNQMNLIQQSNQSFGALFGNQQKNNREILRMATQNLKSLVVQLLFETIHICLCLKNQKDQQPSSKVEFEMLISEISTMVHLILVEESEIIQMIHQSQNKIIFPIESIIIQYF